MHGEDHARRVWTLGASRITTTAYMGGYGARQSHTSSGEDTSLSRGSTLGERERCS